jgi:hypothetical protein
LRSLLSEAYHFYLSQRTCSCTKKPWGDIFFTQMIIGLNKHHLLGSAETEWKEKYQTH